MADPADIGPMRPCARCHTWGPSETCERCEAEARNRAHVAEGPHEHRGPSFDLVIKDEMAGVDGAPGEPGRLYIIFDDELSFAQTHRFAEPEPTVTLESIRQARERLAQAFELSPSEFRARINARIEVEIQKEIDRRRGKR